MNYGRKEDFEYLTKTLNMDLTGKIAIARYGKIYRGDKVIRKDWQKREGREELKISNVKLKKC